MSIRNGAEQAAGLIASSLDRLFDRSRDGIVVQTAAPSVNDEEWFNVMLTNQTIHFEEICGSRVLMIRVDDSISTGINLKNGTYALGARTLEPGILFLARKLAGWEDPTGATHKK